MKLKENSKKEISRSRLSGRQSRLMRSLNGRMPELRGHHTKPHNGIKYKYKYIQKCETIAFKVRAIQQIIFLQYTCHRGLGVAN